MPKRYGGRIAVWRRSIGFVWSMIVYVVDAVVGAVVDRLVRRLLRKLGRDRLHKDIPNEPPPPDFHREE